MTVTCDRALERILEASPEELSGGGSSPLAEHLAACARCRALADEVLEGQAALGAFLEARRPTTGVDEILAAVGRTDEVGPERAAGAEAVTAGGRARRSGRRSFRRRWAWAALPVAAAAALAGLLLVEWGDAGAPVVVTPAESRPAGAVRRQPISTHALARPSARPGSSGAVPRPPRVTASAAGELTVIQTPNPRISVVWIEPAGDE